MLTQVPLEPSRSDAARGPGKGYQGADVAAQPSRDGDDVATGRQQPAHVVVEQQEEIDARQQVHGEFLVQRVNDPHAVVEAAAAAGYRHYSFYL